MKNIIRMAAVCLFGVIGTTAYAGSLSDPVVDPVVITTEAASSSSGTALVALLSVIMMIPALSD